ncbi:MAG: hypothetical protein IKC32_00985 [Clostridia bacterium]|nr:hypothetical protein [Clostridia bacterium]
MKNRIIISIISLLLIAVLSLGACQPAAKGPDPKRSEPVNAEATVTNFLNFKKPEAALVGTVKDLTAEYGEEIDRLEEFAIFYKESIDKLNNLTHTYTLYNLEEDEVIRTVTNSYPDEYYWQNDFGHDVLPEREILDVSIDQVYDVLYFTVSWCEAEPIDEEIVEEEELPYSYITRFKYDFYDLAGTLIASSGIVDSGEYIDTSGDNTIVSFGRTVAIIDEDGILVDSYNGDVEPEAPIFDYSNEYYDYMLAVPYGVVDASQARTRLIIKVFDKEGRLVLDYPLGEQATATYTHVLDSGDILIQQMTLTDGIDYDLAAEDGSSARFDSFILDVETAKLTKLESFNYLVDKFIYDAEKLGGKGAEFVEENVRNVASATNIDTEERYVIFFDNCGNVNYTFKYSLGHEDYDILSILSDGTLLVSIENKSSAYSAIMSEGGEVIAYVPDEGYVLADYIVAGDKVYDHKMNEVRDGVLDWTSGYEADSIGIRATAGNCVIYSATYIETDYETDTPILHECIIVYNAESGEYEVYSDHTLMFGPYYGFYGAATLDDFFILESEQSGRSVVTVFNGAGDDVLTLVDTSYVSYDVFDGRIYITADIDGERVSYLISAVTTEGGEYYE